MTVLDTPTLTTGDPVSGSWAAASPWKRAARRFIRQPAGIIGTLIFLLYALMAIAPSLLAPHNPDQIFASATLQKPTGRFLFGTDPIGRDVLSRVIYGARPSMIVGCVAVGIGALVGAFSGLAAGFYDNHVTNAIMRVWDGVFAVPAIVLGLILAATFGPGVTVVAVAVGIAAAPHLARVSRSASLGESNLGYVEAAEALGYPRWRIFLVHVLPNSLSPIIVQLALTMAFAILLESALAFLGVSVQPPQASWGAMLADSRDYLSSGWWYGLFPGLAITILVFAVNLLADAARDAFDPRADR